MNTKTLEKLFEGIDRLKKRSEIKELIVRTLLKETDNTEFADAEVRRRLEREFDFVDAFQSNGLAKVKLNNKWGIVDKDGNYITPCDWDSIGDYGPDGWALATKNGMKRKINTSGDISYGYLKGGTPKKPAL